MRARALGIALALLPAAADAQRRGEYGMGRAFGDPNEFYMPRAWAGNATYDGRFTFARIKYRGTGRGAGWAHDYPRAEVHFMRIMRSITTIRPFIEAGPIVGSNILALDDPELMKYPVAYLSEPGGWLPTDKEVLGLRNYLLKGGFLIVDDFDGGGMQQDWFQFVEQMRRVLPGSRIAEVPKSHAIFDSFFRIDFDKLVAYRTGGTPGYFGVFQDNDVRKKVMVIINYNQDIGDYWEWSDRGFNVVPSNEAYKLGVNYLIYALTH
ncbi:MAG: DUF4159 domain-containing protein [Gemmatimonadota bacterium]